MTASSFTVPTASEMYQKKVYSYHIFQPCSLLGNVMKTPKLTDTEFPL